MRALNQRKEKQHGSTNAHCIHNADNHSNLSSDLQVGVPGQQDCSAIGKHPERVKHRIELGRGGG